MAYCLRSFVETLDQVLNPDKHHKKWVLDLGKRPQFQSLFEYATFLQDFLDKSSPLIQEKIASLEDQIMDAAQIVADTLETYITDQILLNLKDQSFTIFPPDMGDVVRVFEDAKQKLSKIEDERQPSNHDVSTTRYPDSKLVVGVEEDLNKLRNRLMSDQAELDIIPIVGMGGIGKTTLARILYDEFSSNSHFDRCAWVTISQSYDPQQVLKTILACVTGKPLNEKSQQETGDLETTLYQTLFGRRYLIILDDIWSYEAWDNVQGVFAQGNRSRILFTTREKSLVDHVNSKSHEMNLINDDKSWELLRGKVFGDESCPPELVGIGNIIAKKCGGLPLALQVIGGMLAHSPRTNDSWEYVARDVSSFIATTDDHFGGIFSWSFGHLPHYLKPCFLYMAAFPEDYDIPASMLIKLWVAEGFLYPIPNKSIEEAAKIHLNSLVDRNLLFVRTRKWNGKVKSYGVHDLLRDLCLRKAQEKKFLYVVKNSKTDILQEDMLCLRRVSVHEAFADGSVRLTSLARSFLLNPPEYIPDFDKSWLCYKSSLLRVLDAKRSKCSFQDVILHLVNLRYLDVSTDDYRYCTPRGISVLSNLQTLKVECLESLAILKHLPQLRNLNFSFLQNNHSFEISPHENLRRLSKVPIDALTYLLGKITNLKKLGIRCSDSYPSVVDLKCFQKLETLRIVGPTPYHVFSINIIFPPSLKKLTLSDCRLSQTLVNAISILPELQFLKLDSCEFENNTWEPSGFLELQYLEIYKSGLEKWLATDIYFPVLRHLVLHFCEFLTEIPNDIGEIETLEMIQLDRCKDSVFKLARQIRNEQLEFSNNIQLRLGSSCEDIGSGKAAELLKDFESKVRDHELTIHEVYFSTTIIMFPHSLRKLVLDSCKIWKTTLIAIGVLPELEVLKLKHCWFMRHIWEPSEGQFHQLQHLEISNSKNLFKLFATEIHFPVLQHLAIYSCTDLIDIPLGFGRIKTLETIEIEGCKASLVDSANTIVKEQRELGNTRFHREIEETEEEEEEENGGGQRRRRRRRGIIFCCII